VLVRDALETGALVPVLVEWCSPISGIYLFYPSRRQIPAPLRAFISFMRDHKPPAGWAALAS